MTDFYYQFSINYIAVKEKSPPANKNASRRKERDTIEDFDPFTPSDNAAVESYSSSQPQQPKSPPQRNDPPDECLNINSNSKERTIAADLTCRSSSHQSQKLPEEVHSQLQGPPDYLSSNSNMSVPSTYNSGTPISMVGWLLFLTSSHNLLDNFRTLPQVLLTI